VTLALVDEHGKVVKALVGAKWLTGGAGVRAVAEQGDSPIKIYRGFDIDAV
jgi:hypothetical protein